MEVGHDVVVGVGQGHGGSRSVQPGRVHEAGIGSHGSGKSKHQLENGEDFQCVKAII